MFENCTSLREVVFADGCFLISIGSHTFSGCTALESFEIPATVSSLGTGAFAGCTSLASIQVAQGNTNYTSVDGNLYSADGTRLIQYAPGKTASSFTVPEGVTQIAAYAFEDNTSLTEVNIPAGVTEIGNYVFRGCTALTAINVAQGNANYSSIDGNLYNAGGTQLIRYAPGKTATAFTIPEGVTQISGYAFEDCSNLVSVTIPAAVTTVAARAFSGWTASQSIYVAFASEDDEPSGFGYNWSGDATVVYATSD